MSVQDSRIHPFPGGRLMPPVAIFRRRRGAVSSRARRRDRAAVARRRASERAAFETTVIVVAMVLLFGWVVFITGRIASQSGSTVNLVLIGASLLAGIGAAGAGAALGHLEEQRWRRDARARDDSP